MPDKMNNAIDEAAGSPVVEERIRFVRCGFLTSASEEPCQHGTSGSRSPQKLIEIWGIYIDSVRPHSIDLSSKPPLEGGP